jgi:hypothetical protein
LTGSKEKAILSFLGTARRGLAGRGAAWQGEANLKGELMAQHEGFMKVRPTTSIPGSPHPFPENGLIRKFETGATRDQDITKPDYEGFLSPLVIKRFGEYMNKNRVQPDGSTRDSDNWQKGIPFDAYIQSGWRHFLDWWLAHRKQSAREDIETALCGLLFNVMGYLHEYLAKRTGEKSEAEHKILREMARQGYEQSCNLERNQEPL